MRLAGHRIHKATARAVVATGHRVGCAAVLLLAAVGSACLEPLPVVSRVDSLRVLGVQADPPEVPPGAAVDLSALVVDPSGGRFSLAWYVCLVPDRGQGFFGGGGLTSTSGGEGTPLDSDPDGSSCRAKVAAGRPWAWRLGEGDLARFTVPPDLLEDAAAVALAFGLPEDLAIPEEIRTGLLGIAGLNLTAQLVVTPEDPTVPEIVATRRINVSLDSPLPDNARNTNPSDFSLIHSDASEPPESATPDAADLPAPGRCLAGPPLTLGPGSHRLQPSAFLEPPAPYWVILAGSGSEQPFELKQVTESWYYSFFSTAGAFDKDISKQPGEPDNVWRLEAVDRGAHWLWMVVRDGRGGLAWCSEPVTVE